jgi:phage FluMu gp28-like protein
MSSEVAVPSSELKTRKGRREETYFLPYQTAWIKDSARLKICEKSRQVGLSYADSYDSVRKAAEKNGRDVWVMSRDEVQAKQYIRYCKRWATVLNLAAEDLGEQALTVEGGKAVQVQVIQFASGACIYALSSNPDAIVGKTGHVKLDEYAIHKAQRDLYATAKQVTQWGGTLSIISTHRGVATTFNQIIRDIKERANPMGWSLHSIPIQRAVEEGIVEKINAATGASESRQEFIDRQRRECIDEEQWQQEFCCVPSDDASAFISYEMINACEAAGTIKSFEYLLDCKNPLYVGADVARKHDLFVIDVGEKVGDVMWDRLRIELRNKTFSECEFELHRILMLPQVKRACIDATGMGMQLAERAKELCGWKVEAVTFTQQVKEELAFGMRADFEDKKLRVDAHPNLRADLRGIKKETTVAGNIRFVGESEDSHCDRFWAKALRQHGARMRVEIGALVG